MTARPNQFKVNFSHEEIRILRTLATRQGLSASDYVRHFLRKEYEALGELVRREVSPHGFSHQLTLDRVENGKKSR